MGSDVGEGGEEEREVAAVCGAQRGGRRGRKISVVSQMEVAKKQNEEGGRGRVTSIQRPRTPVGLCAQII